MKNINVLSSKMNKIKRLFQILRFLPVFPGLDFRDERLKKDLERWKHVYNIVESDFLALAMLLWQYPEFRNLVIYRNRYRKVFRYWIAIWYRPMNTLYLQAKEIGGGLFIQHGFATMISAESIGENCWINQQVTIGFNGYGRAPIIGDNVMITCGAKVLGSITVGNNVVIGANAVVIRNVESGAVMGGVPAHKLK